MTCPSCGASAPEGARFCPTCGQPLQIRADERRIVTVLFADLVGFTTLSESRDPESVKELVDRCFERLVTDVNAFGGRVDKIIGDAIVALFGAPIAHEDDAERAVRAGLQMQQTLASFALEVGVGLQLRIGVNTGEVLVGALRAGGDYTAMGDVVNVASRLQSVAQPGQVVAGPATWEATRQVVQYEGLGSVQPKGRDEPVDAWAAVAALAPPGRRPRRTPTPLVGREHEIGLMRHALATAAARRRPQLALLFGEAGIGKNRLAEEIANIAVTEYGATVLEGRCIPYGEANVWWPIAEPLRQACGVEPEDGSAEARQKCSNVVRTTIGVDPESADGDLLVDGLLYLMGHEDALEAVDPARAREQSRRAVHALIEGVARDNLLVIVLSELHWADQLVLDLVDDLFDRSRGLPVVLVATARPELETRWAPKPGRHNAVVLHIDPLDDEAATRLVTALLGEEAPAELRTVLLERSGGNPFFLEEMVSLLAEAGVLTRDERGAYRLGDMRVASDLPATLRGLVAARIDALSSSERATLEDAAVIGHSGPLDALEGLARSRGEEAAPCVDDLAKKDLLELEDDDGWVFRSDLVREVAYETLTKGERARRHSALALWLSEQPDEDLQQLAHHYGVAAILAQELGSVPGVPDDICPRALKTIERAAQWAHKQDIPLVSVRLLDQAEELLGPDDDFNRRRVLLARAHARASLRQLPEARADLDALGLDSEPATDPQVQEWRAFYLSVLGDVQQKEGDATTAVSTLAQAVALWRELGDEHHTADALRNLGFAKLMSGDLPGSETAITEALAMFREQSDKRGEGWALQHLAWISFAAGELMAAEERLHASLEMFDNVGDVAGKGWALGLLGFVRYFQGDLAEAGRIAETILPVGRDIGDKWALGMTLVLLSSVRLFTGDPVDAIAHGREAREVFRSISDSSGQLMAMAPLVRALAASGAIGEAFDTMRGTDVHKGVTYGGPDTFAGLLPAAVALQIGDPTFAEQAMGELKPQPDKSDFVGRGEEIVVRGLIAMQQGRPEEAVRFFRLADDNAHSDGERAHARSWLAVTLCATGEPAAALDMAASLADIPAGTYLDATVGAVAEGFAFFALQQRPEGERAFARALANVDGTGDRLAQAVMRLAYGHALGGINDESAAEVLADAHTRLEAMGTDGCGWDTAYRLAAHATSAPASA